MAMFGSDDQQSEKAAFSIFACQNRFRRVLLWALALVYLADTFFLQNKTPK